MNNTVTMPAPTGAGKQQKEEEVRRISKLPWSERIVQLYGFFSSTLGYEKPPLCAKYTHGEIDIHGNESMVGPERLTGNVRGIRPEWADRLIVKDLPKVTSKGPLNPIHGEYTLTVMGIDVALQFGTKTKPAYSPESGTTISVVTPENVNFKDGVLNIWPEKERVLFCFIEMHPLTFGSPARTEELCLLKLGSLVSADRHLMDRPMRVRRDVEKKSEAARIELDSNDVVNSAKLNSLDDSVLKTLGRATNIRMVEGTDKRQQWLSHLDRIVRSRDAFDAPMKALIMKELDGDPMDVAGVVMAAIAIGVLVVTDGDFLLDGENIDDTILLPDNWIGSEGDFLALELRTRGAWPLVHKIQMATTLASQTREGRAITFSQHDALINKLVADGVLAMDNKNMAWVTLPAKNFVTAFRRHNEKPDEKKLYLIKWARDHGDYSSLVAKLTDLVGKEIE